MSYHKWREWGGPKFGATPKWNNWEGRYESVEPFEGACGDCGKARKEHIDQLTHQEQLDMLYQIKEEAEAGTKRLQNLLDWFIKETERRKNG